MINKFEKLICPLCRILIEDNSTIPKEDSINLVEINYISINLSNIIKILLTIALIIFIVKFLV
jgi:hypothetical protein